MLTSQQRAQMAEEIVGKMRAHYLEHGEDGDFSDALRHLRHDASEDELNDEYNRWAKTS